MTPAQTMTPTPPCWRCQSCWDMVGHGHPPTNPYSRSLDRPGLRGTDQWARLKMSLNVCPHYSCFCLWVLFKGGGGGGWIEGLCRTANPWRILHLHACGTPETPATSNLWLLLCNSILAAVLFIWRICPAETFLILINFIYSIQGERILINNPVNTTGLAKGLLFICSPEVDVINHPRRYKNLYIYIR